MYVTLPAANGLDRMRFQFLRIDANGRVTEDGTLCDAWAASMMRTGHQMTRRSLPSSILRQTSTRAWSEFPPTAAP